RGVVERHGLDEHSVPVAVQHSSWSREFTRWEDDILELPLNPFTGKAVLLVPARFLRRLPTLLPDEFWDWAFAHAGNELEGEFNYDVASGLKADEIARLARTHPEIVARYVEDAESNPKDPYPIEEDPAGIISWYDAGVELGEVAEPPEPPESADRFCDFIGTL